MREKLARFEEMKLDPKAKLNPNWELSLAMGTMATGSFAEAASHFDTYSAAGGEVHEGTTQSGVAHIFCWGSEGVQGGVGVLKASQSPLRSNGNGRSLTPF
jgi:hypothetical protein